MLRILEGLRELYVNNNPPYRNVKKHQAFFKSDISFLLYGFNKKERKKRE